MLKITILALHLSAGGTEKSVATISNMLAKRCEIEIISNYKLEETPAFEIDDRVKIRYLMPNLKPNAKEFKMAVKSFKIGTALKEGIKALRILYLRKALMKKEIKKLDCDIAISTRYLYTKLLGKYGNKRIIKVAQEHNDNGKKGYIRKNVKSLKNIDYLMPVSKHLMEVYEEKLKKKQTECVYIPHCLNTYPEKVSELEEKNIVSIGRLSSEKGFLDLVDVFEMVSKKHPDWRLTIVGEGKEREKIEEQIKEKNLYDKITLVGLKNEEELANILLESSMYVMTSFYESFGLVLIEAESFGIPLLAFDCAKGPNEIIQTGRNGFLVPNRNKKLMANRINELIENRGLRRQIGIGAREDSTKYKMENIEKIWYKFIERMITS